MYILSLAQRTCGWFQSPFRTAVLKTWLVMIAPVNTNNQWFAIGTEWRERIFVHRKSGDLLSKGHPGRGTKSYGVGPKKKQSVCHAARKRYEPMHKTHICI